MNTIYRIVWNASAGKWIVASELAKGRKKASRSILPALAMAGVVGFFGMSHRAEASSTQYGDNTQVSCGTPANGALLNPNWTNGTALCGTAIGESAQGVLGGTAMGDHASTSGFYGVALGAYSTAATHATAVGTSALATGADSFAGGVNASSAGNNAVALGRLSNASALSSVAVGVVSVASGRSASAMGDTSHAYGDYAIALGYQATAGGRDASDSSIGAFQVALGSQSSALGDRSVAVGPGANVDVAATYGVAIGRTASVASTGVNSVALGQGSMADRADSVSVGSASTQRQIVNLAAGTQDTDAVNFSQLRGTAQSVADALGGGAGVDALGAVTAPTYVLGGATYRDVGSALGGLDTRITSNEQAIQNIQNGSRFIAAFQNQGTAASTNTGPNSLAVGQAAYASGNAANAFGSGARATNNGSLAVGPSAQASGNNGSAIGYNANASATNAAAIGSGARASGQSATAIGGAAAASGGSSTAIGYSAKTAGSNALAIGTASSATVDSASAIGANAVASAINSVAIGRLSQADRENTVSFGSAGAERQLVNIAAGTETTDAVNVGQLSSVVDALGGGASVDAATGAITAPTYQVGGNDYHNVGDALTGLDGRVTLVDGRVTNLESNIDNGTIGLVRQDAATHDITVAADKAGALVNFAGTEGARKLSGVAEGELSETSKDAVNGSQLYATNQQVAQNTADITNLDGRVTNVEGDVVNLDGRVTTIENNFDNGTIGLVRQDAATHDITVAADKAGTLVNFAGTEGARKLSGVAEGELSETSKDAVNGSQLYATNQQVTQNTADITNLDGRVTNVEGDVVNLDGRVTTIENNFDNGTIGLVKQDASTRDITVAADKNGTRVEFAGTDGARQLGGVAAGTADTDAVNVGQLKATGLIDDSGDALAAVTYDKHADGTPDYGSVTMGGGKSGGPVTIKNVAAGVDDTDAVNVSQLKAAGLVGSDGSTLDAVVYDAGSNRAQVTFGGINGTLLANVAPGRIAEGSMDAVNGSQLWGVQNQINQLGDRVTNIEIGSTVLPPPIDPAPIAPMDPNPHFASNGDAAKPATATGASSVAAGEGAQAAGDGSVAMGAGSSATGENSVALGNGSTADRADTVSVGSAGNERQVTNVAAGTAPTDAANVAQLNDVRDWAQTYTDQRIDGLSRTVDKVGRRASAGTASAIAMASMPQAYAPGMNTVGAGVGTFNGQNAVSVGMTAVSENGRWLFRAGATANSQGDRGAGVGAAFAW